MKVTVSQPAAPTSAWRDADRFRKPDIHLEIAIEGDFPICATDANAFLPNGQDVDPALLQSK